MRLEFAAQFKGHFPAQQRPAAVAQAQPAVALDINVSQTTGHQLSEQGAPLAFRAIFADAEYGQMLMAETANLFIVATQQHVDQMTGAVTLPRAIDRRQRLPRRFGGVPGLHAIDTVVAMPARLRHVFIEVSQQGLTAAAGFFTQGEHGIELVMLKTLVALVALGVLQHLLEHHHVLQAISHPCIGRQTVTTGAAGFLVIRLKGLGQIQVRDKTYVGFVDAHAERDGRHHDQPFLVQEALLVRCTGFAGQSGVIRQCREALITEKLSDFIHFFARQAIHNARITAPLGEKCQQLLARLLFGHDAVKDVRAVKTRQKPLGVLQVQAGDDFFTGTLVGGGGQGDARHLGKHLGQLAQLQVFRAEVMAPLGHAMGFVDGEQRDIKALQKRHHARLHQAFGRQVEHFHFATLDAVGQVTLLLGAQRRVQ